jgi:hypothetical protein
MATKKTPSNDRRRTHEEQAGPPRHPKAGETPRIKRLGHQSKDEGPTSRAEGENPLGAGDVTQAGLMRNPLPEVQTVNAEGDPHTPGGTRRIGAKDIPAPPEKF